MCFYSLEDFRKAAIDKKYAKCLGRYLEKANQMVDAAGDAKYVDRIAMEPYGEHGFKALHEYAMQTLKMLMLLNGGGAVALLALGGRLTEDGILKFPFFLLGAVISFTIGAFLVMVAGSLAIRSQRYFNEPMPVREKEKNLPKIAFYLYLAKRIQFWSRMCASFSAGCFGGGLMIGLTGFLY